jgi:hypothetical protein
MYVKKSYDHTIRSVARKAAATAIQAMFRGARARGKTWRSQVARVVRKR